VGGGAAGCLLVSGARTWSGRRHRNSACVRTPPGHNQQRHTAPPPALTVSLMLATTLSYSAWFMKPSSGENALWEAYAGTATGSSRRTQ
jgi:hypothetical protein